jgi:hypothetical protein
VYCGATEAAVCCSYVLDGFPSNRDEADLLDAAGVQPDLVLVVEGESEQEALAHHAALWFDPVTKKRYDLRQQSPEPAVKARLVQSKRDRAGEVQTKRMLHQARIGALTEVWCTALWWFKCTAL